MIKVLGRLSIHLNIIDIHLNIIEVIYRKPTANINLNVEKLQVFLVKQEKDKDIYPLHTYSV